MVPVRGAVVITRSGWTLAARGRAIASTGRSSDLGEVGAVLLAYVEW